MIERRDRRSSRAISGLGPLQDRARHSGDRGPAGPADERRRLYAEAREAGLDSWAACVAAGWDPQQHARRERQYQAGWAL